MARDGSVLWPRNPKHLDGTQRRLNHPAPHLLALQHTWELWSLQHLPGELKASGSTFSGTTAILPGLRDLRTYLKVTLSSPGPTISPRNIRTGIATYPFCKVRQALPQQTKGGGRLSQCHSHQQLWPEKALSAAQRVMLGHLSHLVASLQLFSNEKCKDPHDHISWDDTTILCLQKWHDLCQHRKERAGKSTQIDPTAFCKFLSECLFLQGPYWWQQGPTIHPSKMLSDRPHWSHIVVIREQ